MRRKYYLHTRSGIYYAELLTLTGIKLSARSTRTRNRDDAIMVVGGWLKNGLPTGKQKKLKPMELAADLPAILRSIKKADLDTEEAMLIVSALRERELVDYAISKAGPGRQSFIAFLLEFWTLESSPYLRDKIAHGHRITKKYCRTAIQMVERHWQPRFCGKPISRITRSDLREFSLALNDSGLASSTINNIMIIGTTALRWAHVEGIIPSDPTVGITTFRGAKVSRDILTEEETEALFRIKWGDKRAYTAALLSLTTGLRSGEIRALRQSAIGETTIDVSFSYNDLDGLKCPKNGEERVATLLPEIRNLLLQLLEENPHKEVTDPFVFYSPAPEKPCSAELFRRNFYRTCQYLSLQPLGWVTKSEEATGNGALWVTTAGKESKGWAEPQAADAEIREEEGYKYIYCRSAEKPERPLYLDLENRKLDFHSFRHAFSTRMAERMEADKVAKITGHKSKAAAKIYQGHVTARILSEMENESALEFKDILDFLRRK